MTRLLDLVRLRRDHPEERVLAGTVGTVVHVIEHPSVAYVVEVADQQGRTRALLTVTADQIDAVSETASGVPASG